MIQQLDIEETIARSSDPDSTRQCAAECKSWGFSIEDTYAFLRLTEEVNPDIAEERALKLMRAIMTKYPLCHQLPGWKDGD